MIDRRNQTKRLLFGGLVLGSFAAIWLALSEVILFLVGTGTARLEGAPGILLLHNSLSILAIGPLVGLILACAVTAVHLAATRLAGRRLREPVWKARLYLLLCLPLVAAAVNEAFGGPWISQIRGVTWIALGVGLALMACLWGVARIVIHVADRLATGHASRPLRCAAPILSLVGSLGFLLADLLVLPRLYPFFHWVAAGLALVAAWLAAGATYLALGRAPRRHVGPLARPMVAVIFSTVILGLGLMGHRAIGRSNMVRGLIFERSALASKALTISARAGLLPSPEPILATHSPPTPRRQPRPGGKPLVEGADVVLITVDALRADRLGMAGHRRRLGGKSKSITPNMDEIFGKGLRFFRAYTPTPRTSYAVLSLFTGLPLHTLSQLGIDRLWPTLAEVLATRGGYQTAGFFPEAIFTIDRSRFARYQSNHLGFQYFKFENEDLPAKARTDQVIHYLDTEASKGSAKAFRPHFLWVHYFDPHEPYVVRKGFEHFGTSPLERYEAEIAYVDSEIGRLVEAIRRRRSRVLFVLTSDHGEEFGEHGGTNHGSSLFDEQVRVPLLFAGPGIADREVQAPVSLTAVASTLLEWLGVPAPSPMGDAPNLDDLLREGERFAPPVLACVDQQRMIAKGQHKLIQDRGRSYLALYNLKDDPGERRPLKIDGAGEARRQASRLLGHLEQRLRDLGRMGRFGQSPEVGPLNVALSASDVERRRKASRFALRQALRGTLDADDRQALVRAVSRDADPEVRHRLLATLALMGDQSDSSPEALTAILGRWDLPEDLRLAMGVALARAGHEAALPSLATLLPRVRSLDHRLAIVRAMARVHLATPRSVDALAEALSDYELSVPVLRTLASLRSHPAAADAVTRAVPEIHALLARRPEHLGHRLEALAALACVGTGEARELLGKWLSMEPDRGLRARGFTWLLSRERGGDIVTPLVPLQGPGTEAPKGACLPQLGCRMEPTAMEISAALPHGSRAPARAIWLAVEPTPTSSPEVTVNGLPVPLDMVPMARLPADGVSSICSLGEPLTVLQAVLPVPLVPGAHALVRLRDPSGLGKVIRGITLVDKPANGAADESHSPTDRVPAAFPQNQDALPPGTLGPTPSPASPPSARPGSRVAPSGSLGR